MAAANLPADLIRHLSPWSTNNEFLLVLHRICKSWRAALKTVACRHITVDATSYRHGLWWLNYHLCSPVTVLSHTIRHITELRLSTDNCAISPLETGEIIADHLPQLLQLEVFVASSGIRSHRTIEYPNGAWPTKGSLDRMRFPSKLQSLKIHLSEFEGSFRPSNVPLGHLVFSLFAGLVPLIDLRSLTLCDYTPPARLPSTSHLEPIAARLREFSLIKTKGHPVWEPIDFQLARAFPNLHTLKLVMNRGNASDRERLNDQLSTEATEMLLVEPVPWHDLRRIKLETHAHVLLMRIPTLEEFDIVTYRSNSGHLTGQLLAHCTKNRRRREATEKAAAEASSSIV